MQLKKPNIKFNKSKPTLVSLILIICIAVGGVVAILFALTQPLKNIFNPTEVTTTVVEDFDGEVKQNVAIKNTGNIDAWIRAAVVINWVDKDGNVFGQPPVEGTDYTIVYDLANGWALGDDGMYYWTKPVKSDDDAPEDCCTGVLITSCKPNSPSTAPDGYTLSVEIVGSGIQSVPASVFNNNWGKDSGFTASENSTALQKEG